MSGPPVTLWPVVVKRHSVAQGSLRQPGLRDYRHASPGGASRAQASHEPECDGSKAYRGCGDDDDEAKGQITRQASDKTG